MANSFFMMDQSWPLLWVFRSALCVTRGSFFFFFFFFFSFYSSLSLGRKKRLCQSVSRLTPFPEIQLLLLVSL